MKKKAYHYVFILMLLPLLAGAGNYTSWTYYREISLSPSTPENDFQIKVELTPGNFDYSKTQPNGEDIRFEDDQGNALSYWIESWNSSGTSVVWVKVKNGNTGLIYMYYGNDQVGSESDGNTTFDFFDDFNDINSVQKRYNKTHSFVSYSVSNSVLSINKYNHHYQGLITVDDIPLNNNDYIIEYLSPYAWGDAPKVAIWAKGSVSNSNWRVKDTYPFLALLHIYYSSNETYTWTPADINSLYFNWAEKSQSFVKYHVHRDDIDGSNGYIQYLELKTDIYAQTNYANGQKKVAKVESQNSNYYGKKVAILGENSNTVEFDWVRIRKYSQTTPSTTLGQEQRNTYLTVTPEYVNFPTLKVGNSKEEIISIVNMGGDTVHIDSTVVSTIHYSASNQNGNLAPGDSNITNVFFNPQAEGVFYDTLKIYVDGQNTPNKTIPLSGDTPNAFSVQIDSVTENTPFPTGTVKIYYTTFNSTSSTISTTGWQFSRDSVNWYDIDLAAIGNNFAHPVGSYYITWNTQTGTNNLNDVADSSVYFRMKVTDGLGAFSLYAASDSFVVNNIHNPTIAIDSVSGDHDWITIYYTADDPDGNYINTTSWQYSRDSVHWYNINSSDISDNEMSPPGNDFIKWNSLSYLDGIDDESVYFRMKASDGNYTSFDYAISDSFHIDNNDIPTASLSNINTEQYGDVTINFSLNDTENDAMSIYCEYSLDQVTWLPATVEGDTINLHNGNHSLLWKATTDIAAGTDDENVSFRLRPRDIDTGNFSRIDNIHIDYNQTPSVDVFDIYATVTEDYTVYYQLSDAEHDVLRIECYYSLDDGNTWSSATVTGQTENITNYSGSIIWNSLTDVPNTAPSGNVTTRFKIVPFDNDQGTDDQTINFQLVNDTPTEYASFENYFGDNVIYISFNEKMDDETIIQNKNWRIDQNNIPLEIDTIKYIREYSNFTYVGNFKKSAYYKSNYYSYWTAARYNCEKNGGHLVTISSQEENDFVHQFTPEGWIGFTDSRQEGRWEWVTGEDVIFTNWDYGEPNNWNNEDYAHFKSNGKWNDVDNPNNKSFIMEIERLKEGAYSIILKNKINSFDNIRITLLYAKDEMGNEVNNLNGTFFPDDENANPSITLDAINTERSNTTKIDFTLSDKENDMCYLKAYYSLDKGTTWDTVQHADRINDITQYDNYFTWNTIAEGLDSLDIDNLYLRVVPYNTNYAGVGTADTVIFHLDNNHLPSVDLQTVSGRKFDDVVILYSLADRESDSLSLKVEYSIDQGKNWQPATITGRTKDVKSSAYQDSLIWHSRTDIPNQSLYALFKITPADRDAGNWDTTTVYVNNAGLVTAKVLNIPSGEKTGDITIPYQILDDQHLNQKVSLRGMYQRYSGDSWHWATISGDTVANDSTEYASSLIWHTKTDIPGLDSYQVRFKVVPMTSGGTGFSEISSRLHVDNNLPPSVAINSLYPMKNKLKILFTANDAENDTLKFALLYRKFDEQDWHKGTLTGDTLFNSEYMDGVVYWDFSKDLPAIETYYYIKLIPVDHDTGSYAQGYKKIDNYHEHRVEIYPLVGEQHDTLTIKFKLTDATNDSLQVYLEYSVDNGTRWEKATKIYQKNLWPSYSDSLIWYSYQELGAIDIENLLLRLTPTDGWFPGKSDTIAIHLDNNRLPELHIDSLQVELGKMVFHYSVSDYEGDFLQIRLNYSLDGNERHSGTIQGDTSIQAQLRNGVLYWDFVKDLPEDEQYVYYRLIPIDNDSGKYDQRKNKIDNYHKQIVQMDELTSEQSDDVVINYHLQDETNDSLQTVLEYSLDNGENWHQAQQVTQANQWHVPSTYSDSLIWHSYQDVGAIDNENVMLRLTPNDGWAAGKSDTITIHLDNNRLPELHIDSLQVELGKMVFHYSVSDSEDDFLQIRLNYSLDGKRWHSGTIQGDTSIQAQLRNDVLYWDFVKDLPEDEQYIYYRLIPIDNDSGKYDQRKSKIDNYHNQSVQMDELAGEQSDDVTIKFHLHDETNDSLQVLLEYSEDGGNYWKEANSIFINNPWPSYDDSLIWHSYKDVGGIDNDQLLLRLIPTDSWAPGKADTISIHLDNNRVPQISLNVQNVPQSGTMRVPYKITDNENDDITLNIAVQVGRNASWKSAKASLPAAKLTPELYDSTFTWYAYDQLGYGKFDSVRFRVTPFDADSGVPFFSNWFSVGHIPGDYDFSLSFDVTDLALFGQAWMDQDRLKDIGPASGTLPWLIPQFDGKIDFEDLAVFVTEWNWFQFHTLQFGSDSGKSIQLAKETLKNSSFIGDDEFLEIHPLWNDGDKWKKEHQKLQIAIKVADINSLLAGEVILNYDTSYVRIESVVPGEYFNDKVKGNLLFIEKKDSIGILKLDWLLLEQDITENSEAPIAVLQVRNYGNDEIPFESFTDLRGVNMDTLSRGWQEHLLSTKPPLPATYELYQNFPNPFNSSTKIRYQLPKYSDVRMTIYNIIGQKVKRIVNKKQEPGYYELVWDGHNDFGNPVSSGLYIVEFKAGKFRKMIKILLVK